ncbi:MAG TPA: transcription termination/antitermination NusG family protein [Anaerolineales bacterium]|nr:transcription termination/antitermination NusG family protein [Anaerolineales bacterium]
MGLLWYALRTKPRKEEALWRLLREREIPVFYPRLVARPVNPRARPTRPYFPGYLFIQSERDSVGLGAFRWMTHSLGLVSFGGEPASVPEALIHALRRKVEGANQAENEFLDRMRAGDPVVIRDGPLAGYSAIFDSRLPGRDRVRVLLTLLHDRHMSVELSGLALERATRP